MAAMKAAFVSSRLRLASSSRVMRSPTLASRDASIDCGGEVVVSGDGGGGECNVDKPSFETLNHILSRPTAGNFGRGKSYLSLTGKEADQGQQN